VGFNEAFASLTVPAALDVAAEGPGPTLTLDLDLMLEPTPTPDSLPAKHTSPNGWVVDNIENNGPFTVQ
jgi:hypothetical protein